jgi:hypothetical protein
MILRGANNKRIALITAYRVCVQSVSSAGVSTASAQQFRKLSKHMREQKMMEDPKPRRQFIMDLQAWIEHLVSVKHEIILCLDANEAIYGLPGKFSPLDYIPGKVTVGSGHDGSLATLIRTCGLVDPLLIQHPDSPPPSTYSRGENRIDYVLVSSCLQQAVLRTSIMPFDSVFISDHRPTYVDLDASIMFCEQTDTISASTRRGLQLQDPRIVSAYYAYLQKQVDYHKLQKKNRETLPASPKRPY